MAIANDDNFICCYSHLHKIKRRWILLLFFFCLFVCCWTNIIRRHIDHNYYRLMKQKTTKTKFNPQFGRAMLRIRISISSFIFQTYNVVGNHFHVWWNKQKTLLTSKFQILNLLPNKQKRLNRMIPIISHVELWWERKVKQISCFVFFHFFKTTQYEAKP